jgi:hypothetical protein
VLWGSQNMACICHVCLPHSFKESVLVLKK